MNLAELLSSEHVLSIVGGSLGLAWSLFKGSEAYAKLRRKRVEKALRIIEAAAESTYRNYVREIKKARADGKLSEEERRRARAIALEKARNIAQRRGLNLIRELGADFLDLALTRVVQRLK